MKAGNKNCSWPDPFQRHHIPFALVPIVANCQAFRPIVLVNHEAVADGIWEQPVMVFLKVRMFVFLFVNSLFREEHDVSGRVNGLTKARFMEDTDLNRW